MIIIIQIVMERVSVIIPCYNAEKTIDKCLKSVLNQTYTELEIICVNDGSTDDSLNIIKKYAIQDPRVHIINKKNEGVSLARNAGIKIATGKYIEFLDSDDWISSNFVKIMMEEFCKNNVDLVICGYQSTNGEIKKSLPYNNMKISEVMMNFSEIYSSTYLNPPWNKLYKKELFDGLKFDENICLGEDLIFNLEYLRKCSSICLLSETLYYYSVANSNSLTSKCYSENILEQLNTKIRYLTDFIRTFSDSYEITISEIAENLLEDYKWCFRRIICNNRFSESKEIIEEIVESNIWNGLFENVKTYEFENKLLLKKYIKIYLIITRLKHYLRIIKKRLNSNILSFKMEKS